MTQCAAGGAEPMGEIRVCGKAAEPGCDGLGIFRRDKQPGLAILDQFGDAANPRGNGRQAAAQPLRDGLWHAFGAGGEQGAVCGGEKIGHVFPIAEKAHGAGKAELLRQPFHVAAHRPIAGEQQHGLRR